MASDKGKGRAAAVPHASLDDKQSSDAGLDRAIQRRIGDQLRAMYDDLMQQPVPDRFADLLSKLERGAEEKAK